MTTLRALSDYSTQYDAKIFAVTAAGVAWLLYTVAKAARSTSKATKLCGPPSPSWVFGMTRHITMDNSEFIYEEWCKKYGVAFEIPTVLGSKRVIISDPKAMTHFFSKDTYGYAHPVDRGRFIKQIVSFLLNE